MELDKDEARRIAALYMYGILDTSFEERFDRLTRIAAAIFGTRISLISLVDADRQWFKSAYGLKVRETPRKVAFCSHAINDTDVFTVRDATSDERFAKNPLVTSDPNIRFYAGAPLITNAGNALGTLCVIDDRARADFTASEKKVLRDLADVVMDMFELNHAMRKAQMETREAKAAR